MSLGLCSFDLYKDNLDLTEDKIIMTIFMLGLPWKPNIKFVYISLLIKMFVWELVYADVQGIIYWIEGHIYIIGLKDSVHN